MAHKLGAEFIGTFWLVLGGCGSAVLAATFPETGIGFVGVALAFGLTVMTMAYAIGHISGCHLNPAVSIGLWVGGRFAASELVPYIIVQVFGGRRSGCALCDRKWCDGIRSRRWFCIERFWRALTRRLLTNGSARDRGGHDLYVSDYHSRRDR